MQTNWLDCYRITRTQFCGRGKFIRFSFFKEFINVVVDII
jgi:hypothetical protein